jgi:hypothetical protein
MSQGRWHRRIRGPLFRYPPGFQYRRWSTGLILPPIFLSSPYYYYDDYSRLGLGPAPAGYRWLRYGPDLLLVNLATGRIADVVDGVFYEAVPAPAMALPTAPRAVVGLSHLLLAILAPLRWGCDSREFAAGMFLHEKCLMPPCVMA